MPDDGVGRDERDGVLSATRTALLPACVCCAGSGYLGGAGGRPSRGSARGPGGCGTLDTDRSSRLVVSPGVCVRLRRLALVYAAGQRSGWAELWQGLGTEVTVGNLPFIFLFGENGPRLGIWTLSTDQGLIVDGNRTAPQARCCGSHRPRLECVVNAGPTPPPPNQRKLVRAWADITRGAMDNEDHWPFSAKRTYCGLPVLHGSWTERTAAEAAPICRNCQRLRGKRQGALQADPHPDSVSGHHNGTGTGTAATRKGLARR